MRDFSIKVMSLVALIGCFTLGALAQNLPAGVSPALVAQLKSMPPAQQRALAKQYGIDLSIFDQQEAGEARLGRPGAPLEQMQVPDPNAYQPVELQPIKEDEGLKRFGANLFRREVSTFAPTDDAPVPDDYVLGPGDQLIVQLFGTENESLRLDVSRSGSVNFPKLGPITVAGLSFADARSLLETRIAQQLVGVSGLITLGNLRAINVFIAGEVEVPGAYSVSALTTITQALFVAGGPTALGSLRQVEVKRNGETVRTFDLYDLLVRGDARNDIRLLSGDVVFVPPYLGLVEVDGAVKRPALYEIKQGENLADLIKYAGGLQASAYPATINIERVAQRNGQLPSVLTVDLTRDGARILADGDVVFIPESSSYLENAVELVGDVVRPGRYAYRENMRLSDIISDARSALNMTADLGYGLVVRTINKRLDIQVLQFDIGEMLANPQSEQNLALTPRDQIIVFSYPLSEDLAEDEDEVLAAGEVKRAEEAEADDFSRATLLQPIMDRLRRQAVVENDVKTVSISGAVKAPGTYPLTEALTVIALVRAAGGFKDSAYLEAAEFRRLVLDPSGKIDTFYEDINLLTATESRYLSSRDHLTIREIPGWNPQNAVEIAGEVRFPGRYLIRSGETLASLISRAGGLTENAFADGAIFTREAVREAEKQRARELSQEIQRGYAASILTQEQAKTLDIDIIKEISTGLTNADAQGRLLVDVNRALAGREDADIELLDGDKLVIPERTNTISIVGEVRRSSSHGFREGYGVEDYINLAAGFTARADKDNVYVVKANGGVFQPKESLFSFLSGARLQAGDTIVVPINSSYKDQIPLWRDITQIIYQGAVSIAAVLAL